jgi:hypothetical protein
MIASLKLKLAPLFTLSYNLCIHELNIAFAGPVFHAEGTVRTYSTTRSGSTECHTEAAVSAIISNDSYRIKTIYVNRTGSGPLSTQAANDGRNLFQVIEWDQSLLKRFSEGGFYDNTHVITVQDAHANLRGINLAEMISWCAFAFHIPLKEPNVVPNVFPDVSSDIVSITNVVRIPPFGMPSSLDMLRGKNRSFKDHDLIGHPGATFRVLSCTKIGEHSLPAKMKVDVLSTSKELVMSTVVDQAELTINKWVEVQGSDVEFLPIVPNNSTIVDERSGVDGVNTYEFGDVGWKILKRKNK